MAQPKYASITELRGRTVAIGSLRGLSFRHLKKVLERNGLDVQRDVKMLVIGSTPARFQALLTGGIDAGFLTSLKSEEAERGYEIMSQVFVFDGRIDVDGVYELIKELQLILRRCHLSKSRTLAYWKK